MNKKIKAVFIILILVLVVLLGIFYWTKLDGFQKNKNQIQTNENEGTTIANPASTNCKDKGGNLLMQKKEDGSEYGLCYFEDARACEEWAMLRGDCPVGGRKTTGFDTMAQKFCAWSGGQTLAVENAVCTFNDGSTCLADEFYNGTCQKGQNAPNGI